MAASKGKRRKRSTGARGYITSLHVIDPSMMKTIKRAAKLSRESVSKFMLRVAEREGLALLNGNCPTCGAAQGRRKKAA